MSRLKNTAMLTAFFSSVVLATTAQAQDNLQSQINPSISERWKVSNEPVLLPRTLGVTGNIPTDLGPVVTLEKDFKFRNFDITVHFETEVSPSNRLKDIISSGSLPLMGGSADNPGKWGLKGAKKGGVLIQFKRDF